MSAVRIDAPAKINLRLRVLARETSGYHSLETLFCAVSLCDSFQVCQVDSGIHLQVEGGVETGPPERNLVVRAAECFAREVGVKRGIHIHLEKRIPSAAGLGGGSSDAAACLRALNALHGNPLPLPALLRMGAALGSDVPFFLCGSPLALAWGRGERLLALPPVPERHVLIAHPGERISTADAFRRIAEWRGDGAVAGGWSTTLADVQDWKRISAIASNDFEPVALECIPRLGDALSAMRDAGADLAMLSGSGSAIFGLFAEEQGAEVAAGRIRQRGFATWTASTLASMPAPGFDAND